MVTAVAVAAALFSASLPTAASAAVCALPHERLALDARVLQSELMVAALTCDARSSYNAFVQRFKTQLVQRGHDLKGFFARAYGSRSESRLNGFVTSMANEASSRSLAVADYCGTIQAVFDEALSTPPEQFAAYIERHSAGRHHGVAPCSSEAAVSATTSLR